MLPLNPAHKGSMLAYPCRNPLYIMSAVSSKPRIEGPGQPCVYSSEVPYKYILSNGIAAYTARCFRRKSCIIRLDACGM